MLTIRKEQYSALNMVAVLQDVTIFVDHARKHHDMVCKGLDRVALEKRVREILEAGATYGVTSTRDLLTFLDLAMVFGSDWSGDQAWLDAGLRPTVGGTISSRLKRLRLEAIYRLEAEAATR